jgi:rhodanese-related sulfurtransferase
MIGVVSIRARERGCSIWRPGHCKSRKLFVSNNIGSGDSMDRIFGDQESTSYVHSRSRHWFDAQECSRTSFKSSSPSSTTVFRVNHRQFSSAAGGGGPQSYEERVELFELDDKEALAEVAQDPECLFLDIRGHGELKEHGELSSPPHRVVHSPVTMKDFSSVKELVHDSSSDNPMFIEKARHVPIIILCRVGRRAHSVQKILEENGYSKVYNAGGFSDLDFLEN